MEFKLKFTFSLILRLKSRVEMHRMEPEFGKIGQGGL